MKKIAKRIILTMFLCSAVVFAIGFEVSEASAVQSNPIMLTSANQFNQLESDGFWSKFRDSVMKDRPNNSAERTPEESPEKIERTPVDRNSFS